MKALLTFIFLFTSSIFICEAKNVQQSTTASPTWMRKQISNDFKTFENSGIDKANLDAFMSENRNEVARYRIINGAISVDRSKIQHNSTLIQRSVWIEKALYKINKKYGLPKLDFVVCLGDASEDQVDTVPIMVFAKNKNFQSQVLIPDPEALCLNKWKKALKKESKVFPWKKKIEKAFWRGSTTGGIFNLNNWKELPRSKLVLMSLQNPLLIDAKFTNLCQGAESVAEMTSNPSLKGNFVSPFDSLRYKYMVDVDGNTCAYTRLYWTLLSKSVVFKQTTDNMQWYYGILRPFKHYIPLKSDLSDLIEQINWAKNNDLECQKIAKAATELVSTELNDTKIHLYFYAVLLKYASLQNFSPSKS